MKPLLISLLAIANATFFFIMGINSVSTQRKVAFFIGMLCWALLACWIIIRELKSKVSNNDQYIRHKEFCGLQTTVAPKN
jgi:hypothetical protein